MIKVASEADFCRILPLAQRFFDASNYGALMEFDGDSFHKTFSHLLENNGVCLIAEINSEVVGIAGALAYPFYFNASHMTGQELFWWVNPEARGTSVGREMFSALEAWAGAAGCQTFSMIAIDALKPDALAKVYKRAGYIASEHTFIKEL